MSLNKELQPIGYFCGSATEKYMAPKQAELKGAPDGYITLLPGFNFEQALEDLAGFDRIWLLFWFHKNGSWKPKVQTPRSGRKRGLFATRSPHRPNPIGLSCVTLQHIEGRTLFIGKSDLLDGTPILDIKPYLAYADAFPESRQGWIEEEADHAYEVVWSDQAQLQALFIEQEAAIEIQRPVELRLCENPYPFPNHRIRKLHEGHFELALKTWRIAYSVEGEIVTIHFLYSGYDAATLAGETPSRWDDLPLHRQFLARWQ